LIFSSIGLAEVSTFKPISEGLGFKKKYMIIEKQRAIAEAMIINHYHWPWTESKILAANEAPTMFPMLLQDCHLLARSPRVAIGNQLAFIVIKVGRRNALDTPVSISIR
jgi:hypothetical protein